MHVSRSALVHYWVHYSRTPPSQVTPHESVPITTDSTSMYNSSKPPTRSGLPPMQQSQCPLAPEDDHVIGHHMADHVTDAQPCATQAASSAGHLPGLPGSWGFQPLLLSFCQHASCC